ncbi:recombinase family protein [Actinomadura sp. LCR2-06]|uniref:Recombinase family protein n=1 Tax=Actinomadura violacea TaxID=2819934 RepID=A0ABS3S622_9ACTN|nr:recombinase family protein [Actinomadura violacea]
MRIYHLRIGECMGYSAIADRLNRDLTANPAPIPVDPSRAAGRWTGSSVRDVLVNPKNTGYMVWNRRASKTDGGRHNPPEVWVWSSNPTHEALISVETFVAAQQIAAGRERSRSTPGKNAADPAACRAYCSRRLQAPGPSKKPVGAGREAPQRCRRLLPFQRLREKPQGAARKRPAQGSRHEDARVAVEGRSIASGDR